MNSREKFLEAMNFNKKISPNKWEFGFWGETIERWYKEGLEKKRYPRIPTNIINSNFSLYQYAWISEWIKNRTDFEKAYNEPERLIKLPKGFAVLGGTFFYWPAQGFAQDFDVKEYFSLDKGVVVVNVEQFLCPKFEVKKINEDSRYIDFVDVDGTVRRYSKSQQVIPSGLDYAIKDWKSWEKLKEERLRLDNIKDRFPKNWLELVEDYKNRDCPITLGGVPVGLFGSLVLLIGYEKLFMFYYDEPELIKDILDRLTDIWIAVWEEVLSYVDVDLCNIWEDISSGKGSMIAPATFKEFLTPYYKKLTSFLRSKNVNNILVDTDGDCNELIPLFLESGITGLYPMEVSAGMDIVKCRKNYPELQMLGGVPKSFIHLGKEKIDEFLEPIEWLLSQGGYIPFGDHFIPPDVSWEDFKYYRNKLNRMINDVRK